MTAQIKDLESKPAFPNDNSAEKENCEKKYPHYHDVFQKPLDLIDQATAANIQCVAAANLELNNKYHERILKQAQQSFYCAIISAFVGFGLFSVAVIFFMQQTANFALIGTVGTAITAVVSGTSFYLYRHTLGYFKGIHECLARTELLLLGNSLCLQIRDEEKQTAAYLDLIRNVSELTVIVSKGEHKQN